MAVFSLWQAGEYSAIYDILSDQTRIYVSRGEFLDRYRDFGRSYIIQDFEITSVVIFGKTVMIYYLLTLTKVGDGNTAIQDNLELLWEVREWKIDVQDMPAVKSD